MHNTTTQPQGQTLRRYPAAALNAMIRRAGLQHMDIAKRARVSESQVSHTIRRRRRDTEACERVWAALEEMLNGKGDVA